MQYESNVLTIDGDNFSTLEIRKIYISIDTIRIIGDTFEKKVVCSPSQITDYFLMAMKLYNESSCNYLEITYNKHQPFYRWPEIQVKDWENNIPHRTELLQLIEEYQERFPFEWEYEFKKSEEMMEIGLYLWGTSQGEIVTQKDGKWMLPVLHKVILAVPSKLDKDQDTGAYLVNPNPMKDLRKQLDGVLSDLKGYHFFNMKEENHIDYKSGWIISLLQILLTMLGFVLPSPTSQVVALGLAAMVAMYVLFRMVRRKYYYVIMLLNVLVGAVDIFLWFVCFVRLN